MRMMRNQRKFRRALSLLLCGILIFASAVSVYGGKAAEEKPLVGCGGETGHVLSLKETGEAKNGISGINFPLGSMGVHSLGDGELVAAVVVGVVGVALDPVEGDLMLLAQVEHLLPEVGVERRVFFVAHPAVFLPFDGPALGHGVHDILRVGVERDGARLGQGGEGGDDAHELHAVVRRRLLAAGELLAAAVVLQDRAPAPRAGIAGAGAVGVDGDVFHVGLHWLWKVETAQSAIAPLCKGSCQRS